MVWPYPIHYEGYHGQYCQGPPLGGSYQLPGLHGDGVGGMELRIPNQGHLLGGFPPKG